MDYLAQLGVYICIFAVLGTSLDLAMGRGGMFSIAHAVFFGIGAYAAALVELRLHGGFVPAFGVAMMCGALAGSLTAWPALRLRGEYLIVASVAAQIVGLSLFINVDWLTNGPAGLREIPTPTIAGFALDNAPRYLILAVAVLACVLAVQALLVSSPWGRTLGAIRDDEIAALSLGKNAARIKVSAFALSAAGASLAGGLYADFITYINPDSFTLDRSVTILAVLLVGGIGTLFGSVVGAIVVVLLPELIRLLPLGYSAEASLQMLVYGALLVLFVLFRPAGIVGSIAQARRGAPQAGHAASARGLESSDPARASAVVEHLPAHRPAVRQPATAAMPLALELRGVSRAYGGVKALSGVDLQIPAGGVTGIIGPNGAGKTTLLDVITGYSVPDRGDVFLAGSRVTGFAAQRIAASGVVRVFQEARVFPALTLRENVLVGFPGQTRERLACVADFRAAVRDRERADWVRAEALLDQVGLTAKADEPASALSYGQQKLLMLVRGLAAEPTLLLLDEPSVGFALPMIETLHAFIMRLKEQGRTVVIIEHNLELIRRTADRIVFMHEGQVGAVGPTEDVFNDERLGRLYFGLEAG